MSSIDDRIVKMQFDNKQFESGVQTSVKSLDNLKKGLDLSASAKGLSDLDKAGKSFSLAGIAQGVESLANRFSTLGIIGITALQNITNAALNAGKNIISALTIDPIKSGLQEYETKLNAITTILTNTKSKGTTLDQVNTALGDLNTYADKTIYNFAEMTRNIGTFTAAGVGLDASVLAIKGIANLAAGSGSNAQQASTAMYQLSQAMSSGTVKLMDWNSVVNAGMGGELFQKALEKTAEGLGQGRDMALSFRESLVSGWITTEVLTKTLAQFAEDADLVKAATQVKTFTQLFDTMKESVQSGWAVSWENIIGDRDQAAKTLTAINDAFAALIGPSTDARNAMLKFWNVNGGRDALIEALSNAFKGLMSIIKPISEAFKEIFPAMTGARLVEITKAFRDLTANFKIGEETAANLKSTFKGVFAVLDIGIKIFKLVAGTIGLVLKAIFPVTGNVLSLTGNLGDFLVKLNDTIEKNNILSKALETIGKVITVVSTVVKDLIKNGLIVLDPIITNVKNTLSSFGTVLKDVFTKVTLFADTLSGTKDAFSTTTGDTNKLKVAFDKFWEVLSKIKSVIVTVAKTIYNALSPVFSFIKDALDDLSLQDVGALLTGGGLLSFALTLSKGLKSVDSVVTNFSKILGEVGNTLKAFQLKIKADALLKIAIALGILALALLILSFIDIKDLAKSLVALTIVLGALIGSLMVLNKIPDIKKVTGQIIALGIGMLLLAFAVKVLAGIPVAQLAQGVTALGAIMLVIALFVEATKGGDLAASAGGLTGFAFGILILVGALAILGKLKVETLIQGVTAISALMLVIAVFIQATKGGDLAATAGGLTGFAFGILMLARALVMLGKLKVETLMQGVTAITALMLVIAVFIEATKGGDLAASAGGLAGFAFGILILVGALAILGNLKLGSLIQGGIAIGLLMNTIVVFTKKTKGGDLAASAAGLIGFAVGLGILAGVVALLGLLKVDTLVKGVTAITALMLVIAVFIQATNGGDLATSAAGLTGFAVGLAILAGVLALLSALNVEKLLMASGAISALLIAIGAFVKLTSAKDLVMTAGGLVVFAGAIFALTKVIQILGEIPFMTLVVGIGALAAMLLIIGATSVILAPLAPQILMLSVAMALFGLGCLTVAFAVLTFANALTILASTGASGAAALAIVVTTLLSLIPMFFQKVGEGIVAFIGIFVTMGQTLLRAFTTILLSLINAIILVIPQAAVALLVLLTALLTVIIDIIPKAIKTMVVFLTALLDAIITITPKAVETLLVLIQALLDAIITIIPKAIKTMVVFLTAFLDAIITIIPKAIKKMVVFLTALLDAIITIIPKAIKTMVVFLTALLDAIITITPKAVETLLVLIQALLDAIVGSVSKMVDAGMKLIAGVLKGIADNIQDVVETGADIIINLLKGIANKLPDIIQAAFEVLISFINGFADAIRNNSDAIFNACGNLIDAIIDAVISLVYKLEDAGEDMIKGLIEGIKNMASGVWKAAKDVAKGALDSVKKFFGINSPSKAFAEIGMYADEGLAGGLKKFGGLVATEAKNVGTTAMDSLKSAVSHISDVISGDLDMTPTIRPVLDLTDIVSGAKTIGSLIDKNQGITVTSANNKVSSINQGIQTDRGITTSTNGQPAQGKAFSFVQNNYSPAALSRLEIYRQTKNQFSAMKRMVTT